MDYKEGTLRCNQHEARKAIGICTVKNCVDKNLCLHCLNKHDGSHNSRIIFLDENYLYDDDSLLGYARKQKEKYVDFFSEIVKNKNFFFEDAKNKIQKVFSIILSEITKNIQEQELKVLDKLKELNEKYEVKQNFDGDIIASTSEDLKELDLELTSDKYNSVISTLIRFLSETLPEIEQTVSKVNQEFIQMNEKGIEQVNQSLKNLISSISFFKVCKTNKFTTPFEYSGKDYDNKGLFYWLGTQKGEKEIWENPCNKHLLKVNASTVSSGKIENLTSNKVDDFYTKNLLDSWVEFELLEDMKFCPTAYTLGFSSVNGGYGASRNWNFEASYDGNNWDVIKEYKEDQTITKNKLSNTFNIDCPTFYSRFRIKQTGKESNGSHFLTISGVELYGELNN